LVLAAVLLGLCPGAQALAQPAAAAGTAPADAGRVYLLVVDKLSITDLNPAVTPQLAALARDGAVGLASNRSLRTPTGSEDGCLTIGAGNLARSYGKGIVACNRDEVAGPGHQTAVQLYRALMGAGAGDDAVLATNLPDLLARLEKEHVTTVMGSLGELVRRQGLAVGVLGNGDAAGEKKRAAVAIAMDAGGRVALGDVGPATLRPAPESVLGEETDYDYLRSRAAELAPRCALLVIELSDLARWETAPLALPELQAAERQRILRNIDRFAGQVRRQMRPQDTLLVVSPSAAAEQLKNKNSFTPVLAFGPGYRQGFLTSAATRRDYVIASTDIAPTVLKALGLAPNPAAMIGQAATCVPAPGRDTLAEARELALARATANRLTVPLVTGYVSYEIIVIILAWLCIQFFPRFGRRVLPLVLSLAVGPLVLLPLSFPRLPADWVYVAAAIAATAALTWLFTAVFRRRYLSAFVAISALTLVALNLDALQGFALVKTSVLGYDPMTGARYYGLGNEYTGVLLGCALVVSAAVAERFRQRWVLLPVGAFLVLQAVVLGAPGLGAQSDGVITAPAAILVTMALMADVRIRPRTLLLIGLGVLAAATGLALYDMSRPPELQSHIGRAASQIAQGGWQEAATIIGRKVEVNLKLVRYSIWGRVLVVILVAVAALVWRPVGIMARLQARHPVLFKGFAGIVAAALVGLIINDSGIVAAATISIYLGVPILILMLNETAGAQGPADPPSPPERA
jgi:hypothetical protein